MNMTIHIGDALAHGYGLLRLPRMTSDEFWQFCQDNPTLQVERNAEGDIILMPSSDAWTESRTGEIGYALSAWSQSRLKPGLVFGGGTAFTLPNGAERSPDTAWIAQERWSAVAPDRRRHFAHVTPDFVVEVLSPYEHLEDVQTKMDEYMANGVRLGWLIDRKTRTVDVYRPGEEAAQFDNPVTLSGDPEMPGFTADLQQVFLSDTGESSPGLE